MVRMRHEEAKMQYSVVYANIQLKAQELDIKRQKQWMDYKLEMQKIKNNSRSNNLECAKIDLSFTPAAGPGEK